MKKLIILINSFLFSFIMCLTSYAGTWTQGHPESGSNVEGWIWYYIKDDGTYACNEWILDCNTWYWIDETGQLPVVEGFADDGSIYNSRGEYVDFFEGYRKPLVRDDLSLLRENMTYEQVVEILGLEHCSYVDSYDDLKLSWYSHDLSSGLHLTMSDGLLINYFYMEDTIRRY